MWWSSSWERKTEIGLPSAAQTLLKFTPAAITRTITSNAPGSGTSISSIWKASFGSPSRSSRITHAAIVSGSVPGSTFTSVTSRVAMREDIPSGFEVPGDGTGGLLTRTRRGEAQLLDLGNHPGADGLEGRGRPQHHLQLRDQAVRVEGELVDPLDLLAVHLGGELEDGDAVTRVLELVDVAEFASGGEHVLRRAQHGQ